MLCGDIRGQLPTSEEAKLGVAGIQVRGGGHSLRHYNVLLHIQSFETTAKTTSSATTNVAANSAMLLLVIAQTVAFDVGSEDGFP
jgi:hypothetical protein